MGNAPWENAENEYERRVYGDDLEPDEDPSQAELEAEELQLEEERFQQELRKPRLERFVRLPLSN